MKEVTHWAQPKRRKKNDPTYGTKSNVIQMTSRKEEHTPLLRKYYAENAVEEANAHRAVCSDPKCDEFGIICRDPRWKVVAMLQPGHPKEIFLAPYGRDSKNDYKPYQAFQLETGEEIAAFFNEDGSLKDFCCACGSCDHTHQGTPMCLILTCHNQGVSYVIDPDGLVGLICKECKDPTTSGGFPGYFKVAQRPKISQEAIDRWNIITFVDEEVGAYDTLYIAYDGNIDPFENEGNTGVVSRVAFDWLEAQPEVLVPGVLEMFRIEVNRRRHGVAGGIGSKQLMHCSNAYMRVYAQLTDEQREQAKQAADNLIDKAAAEWPWAGYKGPSEPAATPEEHAENKRSYEIRSH